MRPARATSTQPPGVRADPGVPGGASWRARPALAALLHVAAYGVPVAFSVVVVLAASSVVPSPRGSVGIYACRWVVLSAAATVFLIAAGKLSGGSCRWPRSCASRSSSPTPRLRASSWRGGRARSQRSRNASPTHAGPTGNVRRSRRHSSCSSSSRTSTTTTGSPVATRRGSAPTRRASAANSASAAGELDLLNWAALLHDVGKLDVPHDVLTKAGRPSDHEWELLRRHPEAERSSPRRYGTGSASGATPSRSITSDGTGRATRTACRDGHLARGADRRRGGRLRRDHVLTLVQAGGLLRGRRTGARTVRRDAVRPGGRARVSLHLDPLAGSRDRAAVVARARARARVASRSPAATVVSAAAVATGVAVTPSPAPPSVRWSSRSPCGCAWSSAPAVPPPPIPPARPCGVRRAARRRPGAVAVSRSDRPRRQTKPPAASPPHPGSSVGGSERRRSAPTGRRSRGAAGRVFLRLRSGSGLGLSSAPGASSSVTLPPPGERAAAARAGEAGGRGRRAAGRARVSSARGRGSRAAGRRGGRAAGRRGGRAAGAWPGPSRRSSRPSNRSSETVPPVQDVVPTLPVVGQVLPSGLQKPKPSPLLPLP